LGRVTIHAGRCNGDFQIFGPSSDTIFPTVYLEMFISCDRDLVDLLVSPEVSFSRLAARTVPS
jgi:hypothetical protein